MVKDIRRATRRHFSAEDKIRIVLDGLRGDDSIAELCRKEGIAQSPYYVWSKEFMEAGKRRLAGDTVRAATSDEVKDLRREASALKECVDDLTLENLTKLITGSQVGCVSLGRDKHGRTLARCSAGDVDLNRTMVATGYALAYRRYSMDYVSAEESAKVAKRGIWPGTFELPSDVRQADDDYQIQDQTAEQGAKSERPVDASLRAKPQPSGNCRIKGNRSRKGIGIYHLPGMPYYSQTVAEEIFCTEAQARAAGYRRSRADRHR